MVDIELKQNRLENISDFHNADEIEYGWKDENILLSEEARNILGKWGWTVAADTTIEEHNTDTGTVGNPMIRIYLCTSFH